ncbi:prefoldin subunit alpha [Candidatus Woesearchaeota archaeon]|nr:MAG: prefoldin subunit alpha [Candidatus Woesearchaeota archaeon]
MRRSAFYDFVKRFKYTALILIIKMVGKEHEKELQEKFAQFQMVEQQLKQTQEQLQALDNNILEIKALQDSLDEIPNIKPGTEILVPISNGIFIKAELKENKSLKLNVGSGTVVEKSVDDAKKLIEKQFNDANKVREGLLENMQHLAAQAKALEEDLSKLVD